MGLDPHGRSRMCTAVLHMAIVLGVVVTATGCSPPEVTTATTTTAARVTAAPTTSIDPVVIPSGDAQGKILVSLQNRTGSAEEATEVNDEALFLAVNCTGRGTVTVTVTAAAVRNAGGTMRCGVDRADTPFGFEMDTRYSKGPTTIRVDAEPEQRWALMASEGPHTKREPAAPGS